MTDATDFVLILCTCPDTGIASMIAEDLVDGKLAACVNILPGLQSVFRWQGRVDTENECLLLIKTQFCRYRDAEKAIQAKHPYELPEIIAVPISTGLGAYLDWVRDSTTD